MDNTDLYYSMAEKKRNSSKSEKETCLISNEIRQGSGESGIRTHGASPHHQFSRLAP